MWSVHKNILGPVLTIWNTSLLNHRHRNLRISQPQPWYNCCLCFLPIFTLYCDRVFLLPMLKFAHNFVAFFNFVCIYLNILPNVLMFSIFFSCTYFKTYAYACLCFIPSKLPTLLENVWILSARCNKSQEVWNNYIWRNPVTLFSIPILPGELLLISSDNGLFWYNPNFPPSFPLRLQRSLNIFLIIFCPRVSGLWILVLDCHTDNYVRWQSFSNDALEIWLQKATSGTLWNTLIK